MVTHLHAINQTVGVMNSQVSRLSEQMRSVERKLGTLYTPFQSAIYSHQQLQQQAPTATTTSPAF